MIGDLFLKFFNSVGVGGADFAYDEDGDQVECDMCHMPLVYRDGEYYCVECDEVWSRDKFFDYIGAEPPSSDCYSCDCKYPCETCHLGYIDEEEEEDY